MKPAVVSGARLTSVQSLAHLLEEVIRNPSGDEARRVGEHLGRQNTLARFSDADYGVVGCSLNTLKRSATLMPGGYPALDNLRLRALSAISTKSEAIGGELKKTTKRQLQAKTQKLKESLDCATEDLMLLTSILEKAMRQARLYAHESKKAHLIERCEREQEDLRDMMSLRRTVQSSLRVVT